MFTTSRLRDLSRALRASVLQVRANTIRWAIVVLLAMATVTAFFSSQIIRDQYEIISLRLFPSAERAFSYGENHFDTNNGSAYDVDLARYFFFTAVKLDAKYTYVNHELARIEFLHGHFQTALLYINREIQFFGETVPKSYYVRGLIEGYMTKYADAARDYRVYITHDPTNWASTNDLAWVLLKDNRPQEALDAIDAILPLWPENPWLLNSKATALFELGRLEEAHKTAQAASSAVVTVTGQEWSKAYPGNDPLIGGEGAAAFQNAVFKNMHTITLALQKSTKSVR